MTKLILLPFMMFAANTLVAGLSLDSKVVVFGGTGYVGSQVCERLVEEGFDVTGVSRRGVNPRPENDLLERVNWVSGDATNPKDVEQFVMDSDAVVHAVGLLFDVESGLEGLNTVVSGSKSIPDPDASTYDNITRRTMFNILDSIEKKVNGNPIAKLMNGNKQFPLAFVSCAEAGWRDVPLGDKVDDIAPGWLKSYLKAKRAVESRMFENSPESIRPIAMRPSLIWSWDKLDVLPIIPVFNIACALGVPFIDKTIRVEALADAIVQSIKDDTVSGVQRYMNMEELAEARRNEIMS
mmetsp:Transcript_8032/g.8884  ORF Transcript_8032/g.8884 Transcript_8032/m.8884 type:complete len:295 (+) Transcript_8032:64-948(+)|eukprot:CAMPEP_0194132862 /NCGR_PEP_ID=MMETSP0152-20130528/3226_1 /TAXON_ID=1049557 /ORGANISM="Thalassiothrix antarctica, Strain L6-D1" /LENGTH=294 /DNA_ID=CAMNT_0038828043 /DNA_START=64 /DNA_END=948 /DNA_ORIENTATION=+